MEKLIGRFVQWGDGPAKIVAVVSLDRYWDSGKPRDQAATVVLERIGGYLVTSPVDHLKLLPQ